MKHLYDHQGDLESRILSKMVSVGKAEVLLSIDDNKDLACAMAKVQRNIEELRKQLRGVNRIIARYALAQ